MNIENIVKKQNKKYNKKYKPIKKLLGGYSRAQWYYKKHSKELKSAP